MSRAKLRWIAPVIVFAAGVLTGSLLRPGSAIHAQSSRRVFEIRTYTVPEGKLDALNARFREHTVELFKKHNMTSVGYWVPQDSPASQNTLIYILAHPDRESAKANWAAFGKDPEWRKTLEDSERDGKLTSKIESVFLDPTNYSAIK